VPTFLDGRVKKSAEILGILQTHFADKLCPPIRYNVRISASRISGCSNNDRFGDTFKYPPLSPILPLISVSKPRPIIYIPKPPFPHEFWYNIAHEEIKMPSLRSFERGYVGLGLRPPTGGGIGVDSADWQRRGCVFYLARWSLVV